MNLRIIKRPGDDCDVEVVLCYLFIKHPDRLMDKSRRRFFYGFVAQW